MTKSTFLLFFSYKTRSTNKCRSIYNLESTMRRLFCAQINKNITEPTSVQIDLDLTNVH